MSQLQGCPNFFRGWAVTIFSWANVDSGLQCLSSATVHFLNQGVGLAGCCHVFLLHVCWHMLLNSHTQAWSEYRSLQMASLGYHSDHWLYARAGPVAPLCISAAGSPHPGLWPQPFCSVLSPPRAPVPHLQWWPCSISGIMVPWTPT